MWKFTKCPTCGREYLWFICLNCKNNSDTKSSSNTPKSLGDIKVEVVESRKIVDDIIKQSPSIKSKHWLAIYSSSYLHNKLKMDLNSIKKEVSVVKVWDNQYVLREDIINKFKRDFL